VTVVVEIVVEPENPENDGACGETSGEANLLENGSAVELTKPKELSLLEVLTGGRSVFLSVAVFLRPEVKYPPVRPLSID
jgi:hypothetical protein